MTAGGRTGSRIIQSTELDGTPQNSRETGQRDLVAFPNETDRDRDGALAEVREPKRKVGLREPQGLTQDKTRQSDTRGLAHGEGDSGAAREGDEATAPQHERRPL